VVPVEDARQLYPPDRPSFVELLRSIPEDIEFERDPSPFREVDHERLVARHRCPQRLRTSEKHYPARYGCLVDNRTDALYLSTITAAEIEAGINKLFRTARCDGQMR
jgi:hypothetical protein